MKHFGDITKINGWEVPIVDVVTGGSPCQDLSVAGKRAGLKGERSGLFMDQVRIVKEMREHDVKTNGHLGVYVRPRYLVWENVTGALSSNNGEDFMVVLEEICKISDKDAVIPGPSGKWSNAGCIMGNGWSVAWRVHDAQYWGVPQRRKRICVLADFGGVRQERYSLNCSEKPLTEVPTRLSEILEENPNPKYNLSAKACQGILNRASRRGKKLPEQLEKALTYQAYHSLNEQEKMGGQGHPYPTRTCRNPVNP